MATKDLAVRTACIVTRDKLPDRVLFCGKIAKEETGNGQIFYLIEILSPWFPSAKVKNIILRQLERIPVSADSSEKETFFEQAVLKINDSLDLLAQSGEKDWIGNLNAILGFINKNEIVIAQTGKISGHIFRKGKISTITDADPVLAPLPANTFSDVICGKVAHNDRVIFGNDSLFNHFSLDRLRHLVETRPARQIAFETCKALKRNRAQGINMIAIDITRPDKEEKSGQTVSALPENYYLDEPEENIISSIKKTLEPFWRQITAKSAQLGQAASKNSQVAWEKSKKNWNSKFAPQTKKILEKSNYHLANGWHKTTSSLSSKLAATNHQIKHRDNRQNAKIKTFSYANKTAKYKDSQKIILSALNKIRNLVLLSLQPSNRKYLYLLLIFIFIGFGYMKIRANNSQRSQEKQQQTIINSYDEAEKIFENAKQDIALGRDSGKNKLEEAQTMAIAARNHESTKEKSEQLIKEIQSLVDKLTQTTRFSNPANLFTLGDNVRHIAFTGTEIYGIDPDGKIFYADIREKEPKLAASIGKDYGAAVGLTYSKTLNKIYIYTDKNSCLEYDPISKTFSEIKVIEGTGKWEDAKSIITYASNIYLLDSEAGEVWKHLQRDGGYSKGSTYIDTGKISIRGAVDFTVDGDFYVLQNNTSAARFIKGAFDPAFALKEIPSPGSTIDIPAQIYTDVDSNHLFILDKKLNRILKFTKTGDFVNQYAFDGISAEYFVINSKLQKMWVLAKGNIHEIDL